MTAAELAGDPVLSLVLSALGFGLAFGILLTLLRLR